MRTNYDFQVSRLSTLASMENQIDYDAPIPLAGPGLRPMRNQWTGVFWNLDEIKTMMSQEWIDKFVGYYSEGSNVNISVKDNGKDGEGFWITFFGPDSENPFFGVRLSMTQLALFAEAICSAYRHRKLELL